MANQTGNGRNVLRPDENRESWNPTDQRMQRDGDDEDRFERDRDRGRHREDDRDRMTDRRGAGQSGYGAGRHEDDRSKGFHDRSAMAPSAYDDEAAMGLDDRWTGRGYPERPDRFGPQGMPGCAAEDCVDHLPGVEDVQNQLRVGGDRGNPAQTGRVTDDKRHRA